MKKRLKATLDKVRGKSPVELARESLNRTRRASRQAIARASDRRGSTYVTEAQLARALEPLGRPEAASAVRHRSSNRLTPGLSRTDETARIIKRLFPDSVEQARLAADCVADHRVTLFGVEYDLGAQIDWHRDPQSGYSYPADHFTRIRIQPGLGVDPRRVWELNRLHQLVALGRGYALTRDERYTDEFTIQIASWYEQNAPRFGINWTTAMEAGIRSINLIAAFEMFRHSRRLSDDAISLVLKLLLAHGRFIRANLERSHFGSSNHYLANLIGLMAIGASFPELKPGLQWLRFARRELEREIAVQVLDDGVDWEGSTAYHRLVLEMVALGWLLSDAAGAGLSHRYRSRVESMFEFVRCYLKPDGTAPTIGDSDDGRLLKFKERAAADHSYLLPLGAALTGNGALKQSSTPDEETIWWLGPDGLRAFEALPITAQPVQSAQFSASQIFIQRSEEMYAVIDCGDHGIRGRGSHAHSDALSFELAAYGTAFLRDPGTYAYSASECRRNLFRSTVYHNTVRIDRKDISRIVRGRMFALGANVKPKINQWLSTAERDVLDAEHHGYAKLSQPLIHRRILTFEKREGYWHLRDVFSGEGKHLFEFFFNFDAGLEVSLFDGGRVIASGEHSSLAMIPVSGLAFDAQVVSRWVSPAYGTRLRSSGMIYTLRAAVTLESLMLLVPFRKDETSRLERIEKHWRGD